jgi:uroporphyrinogen-III synthase
VVRLEVYERRPRAVERATLESERPDVVIVSSAEAGERLLEVWPGVAQCAIVAPSVRVAEALEARGCGDVWIGDGASADAVVGVLEQIKLER